jgi:hypothetical protein
MGTIIFQDGDFKIKYFDFDHEYRTYYKDVYLSSHKIQFLAEQQLNVYKLLKTTLENGKN